MREAISAAAVEEDAALETERSTEATGGGLTALVLGFLATPAGQSLNARIADWVGALNEGNRARHKRETTDMHWRYGLMTVVIATAAGLKLANALDSTIVGFLGLALGYLFGRAQKAD